MKILRLGNLSLAGFSRLGCGLASSAGAPIRLQSLANGFPTAITGGSQIVADYAGVLRKVNSGVPAIQGGRFVSAAAGFADTLIDGTTPLQPFRMVRTKNGAVKEYIDILDRRNSVAYTAGQQVNGVATDGIRRYYTCTTPGTSHSSAPTWPTSGTVTDGGVTWTYAGYCTMNYSRYLGEPARTNKCTCRKTNPTDTTNFIKGGDAAAVFSVVDDTAALTAAGLIGLCTSGKVYKLDNSAGVTSAYVNIGGAVGNTNVHSWSVYLRGSAATFYVPLGGSVKAFTASPTYVKGSATGTTSDTARTTRVEILAGATVYFILPELIESSFIGSPVAPGPGETDALASYTIAATVNSKSTTNVLRTQNCAVWGEVTPSATGQATPTLFSSYTDANNSIEVYLNATTLRLYKVIAGAFSGPTATYTHLAGIPLQYQAAWTDQGMIIRTRSLTAGVWSAWSAWATDADALAAPIASTYQVGSRNSIAQFAGNYPDFKTLFLPTFATLAEYQAYVAVDANWGA